MEVQNLLSDISILTSIPQATLKKLTDKASLCICNDFAEMMLNKENTVFIDIGIGQLGMQLEADTISYKFIPSEYLESTLMSVSKNKTNPLETTLDKNLVTRILSAYKDLF